MNTFKTTDKCSKGQGTNRSRGQEVKRLINPFSCLPFRLFALSVTLLAIYLLTLLFCFAYLSAQEIKFATLAPEGSTWIKILREWDAELRKMSDGALRFRIYAGGVSGDEKDVIRKMRIGQLHAGGFTGVGLGETAASVRILDTPFLFENSREIDFIVKKFEKEWEEAFRKNGYILLGWAEVGFVYFFTTKPIQNLSELKNLKMWAWEGDPIAEASFKSLGATPIPLSISDVLSSLQTGLIEGVYCSPMALVALQWFTRTKFMYDLPLANASGAVLISKRFFDGLPKNFQEMLVSTGKKHLAKLTELSRKENREAIQALKKQGVKVSSPPSKKLVEEYKALGKNARQTLLGKLYDEALLSKIEKALEEHRSASKD